MRAAIRQLEVEEITGPHVLDLLEASFDELADRWSAPITSRRPWLAAWVAAYPQVEPWAVTVREAGELVGACLLARSRHAHCIQVTALGHGRNDRTRLFADDDDIAELMARRVALTLQHDELPWVLRIEQLPLDDPVATALRHHLPNALTLPGGDIPGVEFAQQPTPSAHLSKNLRRQLQKSRNRIDADRVVAVTSFTRSHSAHLELLDEIEHVHRTRDHDVGRASDIDDASGRQLWRNVISTYTELGQTEIAVLRLDGVLAAYVISFLDHATYRVFDGRFDTHWARYSPGRLLEVETLAHAMSHHGSARLDWMNSIASDKLICANSFEPTVHLVASSSP